MIPLFDFGESIITFNFLQYQRRNKMISHSYWTKERKYPGFISYEFLYEAYCKLPFYLEVIYQEQASEVTLYSLTENPKPDELNLGRITGDGKRVKFKFPIFLKDNDGRYTSNFDVEKQEKPLSEFTNNYSAPEVRFESYRFPKDSFIDLYEKIVTKLYGSGGYPQDYNPFKVIAEFIGTQGWILTKKIERSGTSVFSQAAITKSLLVRDIPGEMQLCNEFNYPGCKIGRK